MKKYIKYLLLFFIFLFILLVPYNCFFGDSIANLGFSYAIRLGQIPYNDFNLIIPLFSPFLYSLPLFIYNSSISFYVMQAILLTCFYYLLEVKLQNKILLFFSLILCSFPLALVSALFPGYNFLLFLIILLLGYLEEKDSNDYLIGFLIGLGIITKHTIGVFLLVPSILFFMKKKEKLFKRFIGLIIPIIIFVLYLFFTKSFNNFFNLCILGLFDFASNNVNSINYFLLVILILCFIYFIYVFIKDRKSIYNYYLFLSILFIIPLLDEYHLSYFIIGTLIVFFNRLKIDKIYSITFILINILLIGIWTFFIFNYKGYSFINYSYYSMRYMHDDWARDYNELDCFIKNSDKEVVLFLLGTENYFYKMNNNLELTYFDLPNYGNYGYNGIGLMKNKIVNLNDKYIVIDSYACQSKSSNQQYIKELVDYIKLNGKYVKNINKYQVYYFDRVE